MKLLEFLKRERKKSASVAKERLQIIVAHQRSQRGQPDYMPLLEKELLSSMLLLKGELLCGALLLESELLCGALLESELLCGELLLARQRCLLPAHAM